MSESDKILKDYKRLAEERGRGLPPQRLEEHVDVREAAQTAIAILEESESDKIIH